MQRPSNTAAKVMALLMLTLAGPWLEWTGAASANELLTLIDLHRDGVGSDDALSGARGVTISADGKHVYVAASQDHAMATYLRNAVFGTLSVLQTFEDGSGGVFGLLGISSVAVSPDGAFVYGVGEIDDTMALWSRDAEADTATFLAAEVQESGVGGVEGLDGAMGVAVSRDWQVFVASQVEDAVAVFSRGAGSDHTFVEAETDGVDSVDALDGASAVAVSPDGLHVYATARIDDALTVFSRSNGGLDFVTAYLNDTGGVDGLDGALDVVVSPDNAHVYAVGEIDGTVAAFSRDVVTGELTFIDTYASGTEGVGDLDSASSIAIGPEGRRVLVTSRKDNALVVFRRDPESGELAPLEILREGVDGAAGLSGARDVVVSPNGANVYVVASDGNTLAGYFLVDCIGDELLGDSDGDAYCDDVDLCTGDDLAGDSDGDLVCDDVDACPDFPDSADADGDLIPDGCDLCRVNDAAGDVDGDGICDDIDTEISFSSTPSPTQGK